VLIAVSVLADGEVEPEEGFSLALSDVSGARLMDSDAVVTLRDNPGRPQVRVADQQLVEGDSGAAFLEFMVVLSHPSGSDVTGSYTTVDGTAMGGADYRATSGAFRIPAGSTSVTVTVEILGDTEFEEDESFTLRLESVDGADLENAEARGRIVDNDDRRLPDLRILDSAVGEPPSGTALLAFELQLSAPAGETVSGSIELDSGTAIAGADFDGVSREFLIPAGAMSAEVAVPVYADGVTEPNEQLGATLANVSGANVTRVKATGTITDDNVPPQLAIADAETAESEGAGTSLDFELTLSQASGVDASVRFVTKDGSARAGQDYEAVDRRVTISAGELSVVVSVPVLDDSVFEGNETLQVELSGVNGATLGVNSATGRITETDPAGLAGRPADNTCVAPDKPSDKATVNLVDAYPEVPDMGFITKIIQAPGDASRWYATEIWGAIKAFDVNDQKDPDIWLNLSDRVNSDGEGGLLSMAFDPRFPAVPHVYVSYTTGPDRDNVISRISRFVLNNVRNPGTNWREEVLLEINQPYPNHNGGDLAFGPYDGYLYVGFGDGGKAGDPGNRSQNTHNMLGAMIRIDVLDVPYSKSSPYKIPADNPFYDPDKPGRVCTAENDDNGFACPEIYAWGLRNPWRFSIDEPTANIWTGDVGQNLWEEVNRVELGRNYGWDCREGAHLYEKNYNEEFCTSPSGLTDPVLDYPHTDGNSSVIGGFVYRGSKIPSLIGRYVFGDYISGRIWALQDDGAGGYKKQELHDSSLGLSGFAMGADGELYVTSYNPSRIYRLTKATTGKNTIPDDLSDTGCQDLNALIPYDINAPFWSDGAKKGRYMSLPDGKSIRIDNNDDWVYPPGSVLVKTFELGGRLIETRLLMRHTKGDWAGYTYEWNAAGTRATRVRGGKTVTVGGKTWIYPTEGECMQCHTPAAGFALGPETAQLNGDQLYPSTGITVNQITALDAVDAFNEPPGDPHELPALADPAGKASLTSRARAYLHTNCSQCHRPGGPTPSDMDLRYQTPLKQMNVCNEKPTQGDMGIAYAALVKPGQAGKSVLLNRMSRRDSAGMPPTGSTIPDAAGAQLLSNWIDSLNSCQ